jgi:hypothetical protein
MQLTKTKYRIQIDDLKSPTKNNNFLKKYKETGLPEENAGSWHVLL